jgi:hypothetical protein
MTISSLSRCPFSRIFGNLQFGKTLNYRGSRTYHEVFAKIRVLQLRALSVLELILLSMRAVSLYPGGPRRRLSNLSSSTSARFQDLRNLYRSHRCNETSTVSSLPLRLTSLFHGTPPIGSPLYMSVSLQIQ